MINATAITIGSIVPLSSSLYIYSYLTCECVIIPILQLVLQLLTNYDDEYEEQSQQSVSQQ